MTTSSAAPAVSLSFFKVTRSACAVAVLVSLAACGGGGGGGGGFAGFPAAGGAANPDTNPPATEPAAPASVGFSGTAASGLPLTGNVTVKDAKGATRTVSLADGHYDIDLT